MIKLCKYSWKTVKNATVLIIYAPVHDGRTSIRELSRFYLNL